MAESEEPLIRREFDTRTLVEEHPPVWMHQHKQLVYEIACPEGSSHNGHISYSRWPAMEVPEIIDAASAIETAVQHTGFYDYKPLTKKNAVEWHVNSPIRTFSRHTRPHCSRRTSCRCSSTLRSLL